MPIRSRVAWLVLLPGLAAAIGAAPWLPQWRATWDADSDGRVSPIGLRVDADGASFAGVQIVRAGAARAVVVRFGRDGTLDWAHERTEAVRETTGVELVSNGRIALVGTSGVGGSIFVRVVDAASGVLVWEGRSTIGQLEFDARHDTRQLVESTSGDLLVAASDGGDLIVLRFAPDGESKSPWRWPSGFDKVYANSIAALPEGGAVIGGHTGVAGGFLTVSFGADGSIGFTDQEPGEIGNPLGPIRVAVDADGASIVVASPETGFGVPGAMAWKVGADGVREWTRVLSAQGSLATTFANGPVALTANGDVLVAIDDVGNGRIQVLRLAGDDGHIRWHSAAPINAVITTLAVATNGRVLAGGYAFVGSNGSIGARIAEFEGDGRPCRHSADLGLATSVSAAADGHWRLLGGGAHDASVLRYAADGTCTDGDDLFANGFDPR